MAKETTPVPRRLPPDAEQEIMEKLFSDLKISSREIAVILERHGVAGDMDTLQDGYRKRLGQQLMAGIRDETGRRQVLAGNGGEYIVVECCNDRQQLQAVRRRIQGQINGLDASSKKISARLSVLERLTWKKRGAC